MASPSPAVAGSPGSSLGIQTATMTVAGTELGDTSVRLRLELPPGWTLNDRYAAQSPDFGSSHGAAFFVSVVDNTFSAPCGHVGRSPKVGETVEAVVSALGGIPGSVATAPVETTLGTHEATSIELTTEPALPCAPSDFCWWQDSPGNYWWALSADETIAVWILEAEGRPIVIAARTYPGTSDAVRAELEAALASIELAETP